MDARARSQRRGGFRLVVAVVLGLVLLPVVLGSSYGTVTRWLGGGPEHHCVCGMKRGTCGCPECAQLERRRLADRRTRPYPLVRRTCADDDGLPDAPAVPVAEPAALATTLPAPRAHYAPLAALPAMRSRPAREPATPPPRA